MKTIMNWEDGSQNIKTSRSILSIMWRLDY